MPLYEYQCDACGERFEQIHVRFSDPPADVCASCGKGPVHRLLSSPAIQFKGAGWYITDYARKGQSDGGDGGAKGDKGGKSEKAESGDKSKGETATKSGSESKSASADAKPSTAAAPAASAPSSTPTKSTT